MNKPKLIDGIELLIQTRRHLEEREFDERELTYMMALSDRLAVIIKMLEECEENTNESITEPSKNEKI